MNRHKFTHASIFICITAVLLIISSSVWAQDTGITNLERLNFPLTSYEAIGRADVLPREPEAALFVLVDQTVGFSREIMYRAGEAILEWMRPGRYIEIIRFSSAVRGRYAEKVLCGLIDPEPPRGFRSNLRRSEWMRFQRLHAEQPIIARTQVRRALQDIMRSANRNIPHSDIIATITYVSDHIRNFHARRKVLFIISDMLENSSITSFYSRGHVRLIDPDEELRRVRRQGFQANFGGNVTVYVLGLGYFWGGEGAVRERYLDPQRARRIAQFWRSYFEAGNATVGEIGMPMMYGSLE